MSNISTASREDCIKQVMGIIDYFWSVPDNKMTQAEKTELMDTLKAAIETAPIGSVRSLTAEFIRKYITALREEYAIDGSPGSK